MWISDFAIRKPIVTTVVMIALVVFGGIALLLLDTDEFPEVEAPVVSVSVPYPGASPTTVERELIDPMEEAFRSISGVDDIMATAVDGYASIVVVFDFEKNIQEASQDIRDKISEIRGDLPTEMEEPILSRFKASDFPILSLVLVSDALTPVQLTELADREISRELTALPGVASVDVLGGVERELTVELKPVAMRAAGVGVAQVVQTLQMENLAAPVGRLSGKLEERTIRLRGRLQGPADFARLIVARTGDKVVRLGDVADIKDGSEEPRSAALFDGARAVGIDIKKATGYSTTDVSDRVNAKLVELRKTLPEGVRFEVVVDSGKRVSASVNDVQASLLEGALLTILVVFLFLKSWRSTVITGLALPVSVIASFLAVLAFGFTLNTMSLLGLSLAIGILIDDAIVVRENIVRHMEMGKDHVTAAREGTSEIGLAVAATTFSIVVVFVPIAFMGGIAEQWFAPFALTIACSVLVSLFVSFSLDPMLSAVWNDPEVTEGRRSWLSRKLDFFDRAFVRLTRVYRRVVGWAMRHRVAMVFLAVAAFVGALAIPATGLVGSSFFPVQDRSEFIIKIETPPGSNLEYTRRKVLEAVAIAKAKPEVAYTYATVGGQGGSVDTATVYVRLVAKDKRALHQDTVAQQVRNQIRSMSGVTAYISTGGFGTDKQIQIQLTGPDNDVLNRLAEEVAARVRKVPGAVDVGLSSKGQRPEIEVSLDRDLAGTLGVSVASLAQSLRPAFAGLDAGDWIDPNGETRDVVVRLGPEWRERPEDLEAVPVILPGPTGTTMVPLGQVARVKRGLGPAQIEHLDGERVVTVGANTEGAPLSAVVAGIEKELAGMPIPAGYHRKQGGETEDQQEVFMRIIIALGAAVMLMYFILVIQFQSFLEPIPIMASLPLSLIGVMLAMLVTGSTLNLMSMIGVILLMGIVAKNAILLIDFAKIAEAQGMSREEAIIEAGGVRLRPIIMTSVAIIAGMLPVALGGGEGGDFRAPLGRAVIGGVITSTVLTLLVIPTFYDIVTRWRDAVIRKLRGKPRPATHGHGHGVSPPPAGESASVPGTAGSEPPAA
ncbi:MAG TPA: efflux RND transporter permease subunit [Kofleriaceae bacterium]|nr:efflux RND transporter permease subunit [Kofleriaceae bacterium]